MKKKKILTEVFVLFFVAAVFMAVYVIIEMSNDWLAVLGGAAVLLIASYLLLDYYIETKEQAKGGSEEENEMNRRLDELEEVQKAIYTVMKRGNNENAELLRELEQRLAKMTDALERLEEAEEAKSELLQTGAQILDAVKGLRQDYQTGVKNIIKYEKENAKQIAESAHTNAEMTIIEITSGLKKIQESLESKTVSAGYQQPYMEDSFAETADAEEFAYEGPAGDEPLLPVLDDAVIPEETETGAISEEEEGQFDAEAAIKAYMIEQGYVKEEEAQEDESEEESGEESDEEPAEIPEQKSEEEIANTLQSMASGDPNRALTPEEIAAMFAAIQ